MNPATPEGLLRFFGRTDSDSISITAGQPVNLARNLGKKSSEPRDWRASLLG